MQGRQRTLPALSLFSAAGIPSRGFTVPDLVFFYGTLMAGFDRREKAGIDDKLAYVGRGSIKAALFDLGLYPAAVPAPDRQVWGEVYEVTDAETVLPALDTIEGFSPSQ